MLCQGIAAYPFGIYIERHIAMKEVTDFETNDMGLATFLELKGFTHYKIYWRDNTHFWVFSETDECTEAIALWMRYAAVVEPREYNRVFGRLKKGLLSSRR